jgi:hypothetical protein
VKIKMSSYARKRPAKKRQPAKTWAAK